MIERSASDRSTHTVVLDSKHSAQDHNLILGYSPFSFYNHANETHEVNEGRRGGTNEGHEEDEGHESHEGNEGHEEVSDE